MLHLFQKVKGYKTPEFALAKAEGLVKKFNEQLKAENAKPVDCIRYMVTVVFNKEGENRYVPVINLPSNAGFGIHFFMNNGCCVVN